MKSNIHFPCIFLLSSIAVLLFGCSTIPKSRVEFINEAGGVLYTANSEGYISTFDTNSNKWTHKKIKITEQRERGALGITGIFGAVDMVLFKVNENFNKNYTMIGIEAGKASAEIKKVGHLSEYERIIGTDNDFFYIAEIVENGAYVGSRFSKKKIDTDLRLQNHFDLNRNLVAVDIADDDSSFWFVCFESLDRAPTLVNKSKITSEINKYTIPSLKGSWDDARIVVDGNFIWLFLKINGTPGFNLVKLTKVGEIIKSQQIKEDITPFMGDMQSNENLWAIGNQDRLNIFYINKNSLELNRLKVLNGLTEIHYCNRRFIYPYTGAVKCKSYYAYYADKDSLWLGVSVLTENGVYSKESDYPYILRISKHTMAEQLFLMDPQFGDRVKTFFDNGIGSIVMFFYGLFGGSF